MRGLGAVLLAGVAACTVPNPAWLVSESEASSAGASSATAEATGTGAEATSLPGTTTAGTTAGTTTTEGTATTAVTTGGTAPATSEPATSTSGPDVTTNETGTTGAGVCVLPVAPDIDLTLTTSGPLVCNPQEPRTVLAEVLGEVAPNQWKFNVCGDDDACVKDDATCGDGEHVVFTFDGPQELMPTFMPGECHEITALPRAAVDGDPQSCALRVLRFAHTRYTPFAVHYVGAVGVPGTDGLPGMVDWLKVIGFGVAAQLAEPCADDPMNCMPAAGSWRFAVTWADQTKDTVAEGESVSEQFVVLDDGKEVGIEGTFIDVRSRIELGSCLDDTRQQFEWVWLAKLPAP